MTEKEKYTLFLLERFRARQNISAKEAFDFFAKNNVFDYIDETYDAIHTEDSDFVVSQLVDFTKTKQRNEFRTTDISANFGDTVPKIEDNESNFACMQNRYIQICIYAKLYISCGVILIYNVFNM